MDLEMALPGDSYQHACAVCGAPAQVWCHNDEALLCDTCDTIVHSASPLAMTHKRTQIACGGDFLNGTVSAAKTTKQQQRSKCPSELSCEQFGTGCQPDSLTDTQPFEEGSTADDMLRSHELDDVGWNPSDLNNFLAFESFEVNVLDLNSDCAFFMDSEPPMHDQSTVDALKAALCERPPSPAILSSPLDTPPAKLDMHPEMEPLSSCGSECCALPAATPQMTGPVYTTPCGTPVTATAAATSSSGPPSVPSASLQSQDQFSQDQLSPGPVGAVDSAGMLRDATSDAPAETPTPAPAPAMPMMPSSWPQQMMDPSMMWGGGCYMPMFQQHMWATYIPASLLPRSDPVMHESKLHERRAKRSRFQEKKRQLSCCKAVRYVSRKRYADSRPRVNGRFISKSAATATAAAIANASAVCVSGETP